MPLSLRDRYIAMIKLSPCSHCQTPSSFHRRIPFSSFHCNHAIIIFNRNYAAIAMPHLQCIVVISSPLRIRYTPSSGYHCGNFFPVIQASPHIIHFITSQSGHWRHTPAVILLSCVCFQNRHPIVLIPPSFYSAFVFPPVSFFLRHCIIVV